MRIAATVPVLLALLAADAAQAAPKHRLKAFSSCQDLVGYARAGALRADGGVGVRGQVAAPRTVPITSPPVTPTSVAIGGTVGGSVPMPVSAPVAAAPGTERFSGTNTQEVDVDEPDIVKTDGRRIFAVTDGALRVMDVASGTITGVLALEGFDHRLLLRGNRVLVIAGRGAAYPGPVGPVAPTSVPPSAVTTVTEVDVTGAPTVARTMEVPGTFVDARQNGGVARLVVDAAPAPFVGEAARAGIARAGKRRFLGQTTLKSALSGRTFVRDLAPCEAVSHPRQFSGTDILAILTVDLDRGMYSLDRDGVMAGAQVVYGSDRSLYVASRRYVRSLELGQAAPANLQTEIHRFDVSDPTRTTYAATGTVPGYVLNNYALSEHEGVLRVATTDEPTDMQPSASRVTVLRQDGNRLAEIGAVGNLGVGERIYAVRFLGDRGYVVTFRQVDPLYALDLSDPTAPKVTGELKIPGFSTYLHPVDETHLLGVGREGAAVKVALFDVANPAAPAEVAQVPYANASSAVDGDPHAFLYWAPKRLAVLPLNAWGTTPGVPGFDGAVALRVGTSTLTEAGRLVHENADVRGRAGIERTVVVGDRLYTVSWLGILGSDLNTFAGVSYTRF
jgi:uncharacterized secreted protein with C-terminal beta-propeller domain